MRWIVVVCAVWIAILVFALQPSSAEEVRLCEPEPTDMTLLYGDVVRCVLEVSGDRDLFNVAATKGEKVVIRLVHGGQRGPKPICLELLGPDGRPTPHGEHTCTEPAKATMTLETTIETDGIHTIVIDEPRGTRVVYGLSVERLAPFSPTAEPICYGCNITEVINGLADIDLYRFIGAPGDVVTIRVTHQGTRGPRPICMGLLGPDGMPTPNGEHTCTEPERITRTIQETLPSAGVYTIFIDEPLRTRIVYSIDLQCRSCVRRPTLMVKTDGRGVGIVTSTPSGIMCDPECTAEFDPGTVVSLFADPDAHFHFRGDRDGQGWSGDADCEDGMVTMDTDKMCIATFDLGTIEPSVPCEEGSVPEPVLLHHGENAKCRLDTGSDFDEFIFNAKQGETIRITAWGAVRLEVTNPNGEVIPVTSSRVTSKVVDHTLELSGTYKFRIDRPGSTGPVAYTVHLEKLFPASNALPIPLNFSVTEFIYPDPDIDLFTMEITEATSIRIALQSLTLGFDPRLEIRDPNGEVIEETACSGRDCGGGNFPCTCSFSVDVCLPFPGTYALGLSSAAAGFGYYQLTVQGKSECSP